MRRLFFRLYGMLVLVLVLCIALAIALRRPRPARLVDDIHGPIAGFADDARSALADTPPDRWQPVLDALAERYHRPVVHTDRATLAPHLTPHQSDRLDRGEAVLSYRPEGRFLVAPVGAERVSLGPLAPPPTPTSPGLFVVVGGVLLLALALSAVVRDLEQQIAKLTRVADALGIGELGTRAEVRAGAAMAPLADSVNHMADRIQKLIENREELLRAVSHELRSPIQRLRFGVELLADCEPDELQARSQEIQDDLGELDDMVGELLTWSRMQAASLAPQRVELADVLNDIAGTEGRLRTAIDLSVEVDPDIQVLVDRRQFHRAIGNLVRNALRHSTSRVRVVATGPRPLVVRVEDDGPGVPEDQRTRVFDPFVRLDHARERDKGGAGLGLAIAHRIAASHRGSLRVEDSELGGAAFVWQSPG